MKYIDAERLEAELKRQKRELELSIQSQGDYGQSCHIVAYENILSIIDSLQQEQPEVDLEEEVKKYFEGYWPGMKTPEACNHQMVFTTPAIMRMIEHFYELGLNARKEE